MYDWKESQAEEAACRQMEYDQEIFYEQQERRRMNAIDQRGAMLEEQRKQDAKVILRKEKK